MITINGPLFAEHTAMLLNILDNSSIDKKEKEYRKEELLSIYNKMKSENKIYNKYYNISHEIRSLEFLSQYDNMKIALDHKSQKGCDFKIYDNFEIECVCSSSGNEKLNGLDQFRGSGVFDCNKKERIILSRLTQSIKEKKDFYYEHIKDNSIDPNSPYIIFLGLGNLTYGMFTGTFGFVLNKILFGVGHDVLLLNLKTNKIEKTKYSHNDVIINHNGSDIDCNIFCNKDYECISAIIFGTESLESNYNNSNTFLFINPYAKNKINANKFKNMIYWKAQNKNGEYLYFPRYKGKNLNDKLSKKYF